MPLWFCWILVELNNDMIFLEKFRPNFSRKIISLRVLYQIVISNTNSTDDNHFSKALACLSCSLVRSRFSNAFLRAANTSLSLLASGLMPLIGELHLVIESHNMGSNAIFISSWMLFCDIFTIYKILKFKPQIQKLSRFRISCQSFKSFIFIVKKKKNSEGLSGAPSSLGPGSICPLCPPLSKTLLKVNYF